MPCAGCEQADLSALTGLFLDPPYGSPLLESALAVIRERKPPRLAWIYLEWPAREADEPSLPEGFRFVRRGQAGDVAFGLATRENAG